MKVKLDIPFRGVAELTVDLTADEYLRLLSGQRGPLELHHDGKVKRSQCFLRVRMSPEEERKLCSKPTDNSSSD